VKENPKAEFRNPKEARSAISNKKTKKKQK